MKVLVTGGTGVIGTALVPTLVQKGHTVRLLSRGAGSKTKEYPSNVESFSADITTPETLAGAATECEAIIHITGIIEERPPKITFDGVNVLGTVNILGEATRAKVRRFVYVSSLGVERGSSEYHKSKYRAEQLVKGYPGDWVIVRPGNVYGPGDEVISVLLKMVRALPVVPVIDRGDQEFQPVWHEDVAQALIACLTRDDATGKILHIAGGEVTTTRAVLQQLGVITGRQFVQMPVPSWLAQLGTKLNESLGSGGTQVVEMLGLRAPLNSSKLQMLIEENVIRPPDRNALTEVFGIDPTPLDVGLRQLADTLPELKPAQGVGSVQRKQFWADIISSRETPEELLRTLRDHFVEIVPVNFAVEPGTPTRIEPGATLTGSLPMRGNFQVRVVRDTETELVLATIEGHPLSGLVSFKAHAEVGAVRFMVEVTDRASDVFDWLAMRTIGDFLQDSTWMEVVRRMVRLSGGTAPAGVQQETRTFSDEEAEAVHEWAEELVAENKRAEHAEMAQSSR